MRTAYFSSRRSPGVVLRVSTMSRPRARHRRDTARRQRGDAGEPSQEVERGALRRQQRRRVTRDPRQRRARRDRCAIGRERLELDTGIELGEGQRGDGQPGDDASLARDDTGAALRSRRNGRLGGHVATANIFGQRAPYQVAIEERIEGWCQTWAAASRCLLRGAAIVRGMQQRVDAVERCVAVGIVLAVVAATALLRGPAPPL